MSESQAFKIHAEGVPALNERQRELLVNLHNEAEQNFEVLKNAAHALEAEELNALSTLFRRANIQYQECEEAITQCLEGSGDVSFNDALLRAEAFLETVRAIKVELDTLGYEVVLTEKNDIDFAVETQGAEEAQRSETAPPVSVDVVPPASDEAGFISDTVDVDAYAPAGSEILDSEILNGRIPKPQYVPPLEESVAVEPKPSLSELYVRWQSGDPALFREGWWHEFDQVARDASVLLKAAGYDQAFIDTFGREFLKPWMDKVAAKRRHGNKNLRWNQLSDEVLHAVRDLLADKEPDQEILGGSREVMTEMTPESAESKGDEETLVSPDTLPQVERMLERAQFRFQSLKESLAAEPAVTTELELGDRIVEALSNITERDEAVVLRVKQKYLKSLLELNERLQDHLPEHAEEASYLDPVEGGAVYATVPANLPVASTESAPINPKPEQTYAEVNSERAVARTEFTKARDEYYAALHDHYRSLGVRAKDILGMNIELPPELEALKKEHDATQQKYAIALDATLAARAEKGLAKQEYGSLSDETTRAAFAKRFVVRSGEELEAAKREVGDTPEFVKRAQAMAKFVRDHKWLVRGIAIAGYAGVGALTGGASAAFAAGSRAAAGMVGGAVGGIAGGELGRKAYAALVAETIEARESVATEAKENFSFADFQAKRDVYQGTVKAANRAKTKQTAAAMTGAVLGGMAAGRFAAEAVSDAWNALATDPFIEMKAVAVERYAPNGERLPALAVEGITLRGSQVDKLVLTDPEAVDLVPKVMSEIRLHIKDLLEAHPNMNQGKLEEEVFARLEAKYSGQEWWQKAGIKSLDIGTIKLEEVTETVSSSPEEPAMVPPSPPEPMSVKPASVESPTIVEHTVQQGETLTSIMKKEYADVLEKLAPAERDRVLAELFERTRTDAALRDSIGLRTGDVDKIYTGQDLQLEKLGAELKSLIESEPTRPRTGALPVAMEGGVEEVPIKFGSSSPITETTIDMGGEGEATPADFDTREVSRAAEAVPAKPRLDVYDPPRPEIGFVASGNYFDSPQYREYLAENGMSRELVLDATKKFALEFEGKTYSWLNEFLQNFDSPFDELGTMTLKELDTIKLQAGESEATLRTLLSEQAAREAAERGVVVGDVPKTFNLPTVRAWDSLIDAMRRTEGFAYNENTPVRDMIQRYVAEQMIKNNYDLRFKAGLK